MKKKLILGLLIGCLGAAACGQKDNTTEPTGKEIVEQIENSETKKNEDDVKETKEQTTIDPEALDFGYMFYDDLVSLLVEELQMGWPDDSDSMDVSYMYSFAYENTGFAKVDINGDGINELILGEDVNAVANIYDLYTIKVDGSSEHLFSGGERDVMYLSNGVLIEQGSSGANDSFQKKYKLENGQLTLLEETNENFDSNENFESINFDLFSNYGSFGELSQEDEGFMPSSVIEERAGKEEFDEYEEIISYLKPGEGYAYVDILGTGDPVLLVATETYDFADGVHNHAALDAYAFYKNNRGIVYGTVVSSNSTGCPIAVGDGLLYGFSYHGISTQCVSSDTESFMYMSDGVITYDTDGNGTYTGFVRKENKVYDDGNNMHDITPEEYDALFSEYEKAQVVNFTVIE